MFIPLSIVDYLVIIIYLIAYGISIYRQNIYFYSGYCEFVNCLFTS